MKTNSWFTIIVICLIALCSYYSGQEDREAEIKYRALTIEKECYTNQDIEIIIFGETQE